MLQCSPLSQTANRMKDGKYVYFGIISYDIVTYVKQWQDLSRTARHGKRTENMNCEANTFDEEEGGSLTDPNTRLKPRRSQ